jgi:hypothetical protein
MTTKSPLRRLRKDKKALTPAISTTILTSAIIVMLLVTINFANNYLNARVAENEFNAMKQFMQNVGEQIDSVAWIPGQTETIRFASKFGYISFQPVFLNYSIYLDGSPSANFSYLTRILLYNMPINSYNIADNYYERLSPRSTDSFLQAGPSAPVSRTYIIEKLSMNGGSFLRIAVVPCIRMINTTTSTGESTTQNYTRFFLPILSPGTQTGSSQSVTLRGSQISRETGTANNVKIGVTFPNATMGFNEDFFRFSSQNETVTVEPGSIVEFHTSKVIVSIGLYD